MSSKLERDIEEVLARIDRFPPRRSLPSRIRRRLASVTVGLPRPRVSVGQVLLLGIALIVIAYVFGDSLGGASLVRLFIITAVLLFIGAFIFSLRHQSVSRIPEKRWRGQPMDLSQQGGSDPWWKRWRFRR